MKHYLNAVCAVALITSISVMSQTRAVAAGVNCSYDACINQCAKNGASNSGCSNFCTKAMRDRKAAGQCK